MPANRNSAGGGHVERRVNIGTAFRAFAYGQVKLPNNGSAHAVFSLNSFIASAKNRPVTLLGSRDTFSGVP